MHSKIETLEILGDSIENLPSLENLDYCQKILIICPQLKEIPNLPKHLKVLKIKSAQVAPTVLPQELHTLQLSHISYLSHLSLTLPRTLINLNLSSNGLSSIEELNLAAPLSRVTLDNNQLTTLPLDLYKNKTLLHLSLDGNPLLKEEKQKLFKHFGIWF